MKKLLFCLAVLFWGQHDFAQDSTNLHIQNIRSEYQRINSLHLRMVAKDAPEESSEGGEVKKYYSGDSLLKITGLFYGETGKATSEYYISGGQLIFAYVVQYDYDRPMSGIVKSKTENRYYFHNCRLIRWLDSQNKIKDKSLYAKEEKEVLDAYVEFSKDNIK